jgi:hypothetical protein
MKRLASGSIPAEGSSSRMIGGLPKMEIATDSFLLLPPERVPASLNLRGVKPNLEIASSIKLFLSLFGMPLSLEKYYKF